MTLEHLFGYKIPIPNLLENDQLVQSLSVINQSLQEKEAENYFLRKMGDLVLSKMTKVETEKELV